MKEQSSNTATDRHLKVGDVIDLGGKKYVVWFKNEVEAKCAPLDARIEFREKPDDGSPGPRISFLSKEKKSLAPDASVEILESLGREGLRDLLLERSNKKKDKMKNSNAEPAKTSKPKKNKEKTGLVGKLGGYKGNSISSVIRAMAKAGWKNGQIVAFFERERIPVRYQVINQQAQYGRTGRGGAVAQFSKSELASMRPEHPERGWSTIHGEKDAVARSEPKVRSAKPRNTHHRKTKVRVVTSKRGKKPTKKSKADAAVAVAA